MFNFTKKHSDTPLDTPEQDAGVGEKYDAALKKIELLEFELNQKTLELNQSNKNQHIMSERVKNCVATLYTVQSQLQSIAMHLIRSNNHVLELTKKNRALESSGDEWFRRAINLEFNILMTKDELKKIENERDLAVKMCERLQGELMSNSRDKNQG
jgi:chromosome segregation ATPase